MGAIIPRLKPTANRIMARFGYQFSRIQQPFVEKKDCQIAGRIVEMVGTSGVGKSTTLRSAKPHLRAAWNFEYPHLSMKADSVHKNEKLYRDLLSDRSQEIIIDRDMRKIQPLFSHCYDVVSGEIELSKSDYKDSGYLFDEGFFHLFGAFMLRRAQMGVLCKDEIVSLLARRDIIVFDADSATVLQRLRQRKESMPGAVNDLLSSYTISEIEKRVRMHYARNVGFVDFCNAAGCRIFSIDANADLDGRVEQLLSIESLITSSR